MTQPAYPRSSSAFTILCGAVGLPMLVLSIGGYVFTNATVTACSSGLAYALNQATCNQYSLIHTLSEVGGVLSLAMLIIGFARR